MAVACSPCAASSMFQIGDYVRIEGLQTETKYEKSEGVVVGFSGKQQRWVVHLKTSGVAGLIIKVREANVAHAADPVRPFIRETNTTTRCSFCRKRGSGDKMTACSGCDSLFCDMACVFQAVRGGHQTLCVANASTLRGEQGCVQIYSLPIFSAPSGGSVCDTFQACAEDTMPRLISSTPFPTLAAVVGMVRDPTCVAGDPQDARKRQMIVRLVVHATHPQRHDLSIFRVLFEFMKKALNVINPGERYGRIEMLSMRPSNRLLERCVVEMAFGKVIQADLALHDVRDGGVDVRGSYTNVSSDVFNYHCIRRVFGTRDQHMGGRGHVVLRGPMIDGQLTTWKLEENLPRDAFFLRRTTPGARFAPKVALERLRFVLGASLGIEVEDATHILDDWKGSDSDAWNVAGLMHHPGEALRRSALYFQRTKHNEAAFEALQFMLKHPGAYTDDERYVAAATASNLLCTYVVIHRAEGGIVMGAERDVDGMCRFVAKALLGMRKAQAPKPSPAA